ncbi:unnamed protein product [Paramecium octaurelia]|uniref:Uncharacterized protein n=1 Tax=Paramecium octaurelia TaxID=43137 RepID=A0A8S1WJ84_PAROT|nr:unnamed protein product [Paramecium octaurelia]
MKLQLFYNYSSLFAEFSRLFEKNIRLILLASFDYICLVFLTLQLNV